MVMTLDELQLTGYAYSCAHSILQIFSDVPFTRGRSDLAGQARAMAQNVVRDREWIHETYAHAGPVIAALAARPWTTALEAQAIILAELLLMTDEELHGLSFHLSGDAFDIDPDYWRLEQVRHIIRGAPGWIPKEKLLYFEGSLRKCHAQFLRST